MNARVRPGKLRHRIEIYTPPTGATKNSYGEWTDGFTLAATRWGSVETLSGSEAVRAAQVQSTATHKVTLRFFDGLTPRHRLKHKTRTFEINRISDTAEVEAVHELWVTEVK